MSKITAFLGRWWMVLALAALLPVYSSIAIHNERTVDYTNNGFFTFWLSGQMQWSGENPYSTVDWVNGHYTNNATWIPEKIFPYPLPLALFTAPLGLMPIGTAYVFWVILAQVLIAVCILWLATRWNGLNRQLYAIFILLAVLLNGNISLGLKTGTLSALFLVFLTLALFFMEKRQPVLAGIMLAGLALKPPLLGITGLIGLWFLTRHEWKALAGIGIGCAGFLFTGMMQDADWIQKFRGVSGNLLGVRLGNQPTILSYTRLLCGGEMSCAFAWYLLITLALVGVFAWLVWQKRNSLSPLMAFSAAIAAGVLLPPYLWSYDYALLLIPICYICFDLIRRRVSFLPSTVFLVLLDVISIAGLALFWTHPESEALRIQRDMWSIWVALMVLVTTWWMIFHSPVNDKMVE